MTGLEDWFVDGRSTKPISVLTARTLLSGINDDRVIAMIIGRHRDEKRMIVVVKLTAGEFDGDDSSG